jgi:phosphoglycerate-specific signal transduction histidine kinase
MVILLGTAKELLEKRENEQAIEVLDRIENLLFVPQ